MKEAVAAVKKFLRASDLLLLFLCLITTGIGVVLISSAARTLDGGARRYVLIQLVATALGVLAFFGMSLMDVERLSGWWKWLLAFNILFIMTLVPFGVAGDTGNRSWIRFSFMPFGIQPAEVVKITFIILLAKQMYVLREKINRWSSVLMLCAHFGLMAGVIYFASHDMGMVVVYACIFLSMLLAAGVHFRWFLLAGALGAAAAPLIWNNVLDNGQRMRILVVLNPELDPLGKGYHAIQSKNALGAGGLFGQGLYNGTQTQSSMLPAKHTDFIFSVAGEELGLVGCVVIVLLLCAIIARCLFIATRAQSGLSALVCVGVAGMLMFQTVENIGMCLGLTPIIGLTLPFLSYGGSSIVTLYLAVGLISGAKMRPKPHWRGYWDA